MRLWGSGSDPQPASDEPIENPAQAGPQPSPAEAAMLGMLGKMPGVGEAIKGLFQMAQQFAIQQQAMAKDLADIKAMLMAEKLQQRGPVQVPIEGVVADGVRCAVCGSTGACDCFAAGAQTVDTGAEING